MAEVSKRRRIWGWWFFDWASQPYHTLLVTFVFGPYFAGVAAEYFLNSGLDPEAAGAWAQTVWANCMTIIGLIIAFGAPLMGAMADVSGRRIPWIFGFSLMYAVGSAALWFTLPDGSNMWLMLSAFGIGFVGAEYALIFINSQLPDLGDDSEVGEISGSGFAFGYFGGLISLAIMLALFVEQANGKTLIGMDPLFGLDAATREGTRFVGPFTARVVYLVHGAIFPVGPRRCAFRQNWPDRHCGRGVARAGPLGRGLASSHQPCQLPGVVDVLPRRAERSLQLWWGLRDAGAALGPDQDRGFRNCQRTGGGGLFLGRRKAGQAVRSQTGDPGRDLGADPCLHNDRVDGPDPDFRARFAVGSSLPDLVFFGCGVLIGGMGGILQSASRSMMVRHTDPKAPVESFGLYGLSGRRRPLPRLC